ncbi:MAG: D-glycero-beta-D-manno-heptose-7-phosphate kinase [bacterium]|nr:D-glycero-beta-D-manno-heptose-7-phosphate kinase [bacterium]
MNQNNHRYINLLDRCVGVSVAVVGDLMLDYYITGRVERISPEAPVPIIDVEKEYSLPGGAANVIQNVVALGAHAIPFGVIGNDLHGEEVLKLLQSLRCMMDGVIVDPHRPTTTKTRIMAGSHHIVRVDYESRHEIDDLVQQKLMSAFREAIEADHIRAIVIQDYNKGVMREDVIRGVIQIAKEFSIPVLVDPKQKNFFAYQNVSVFKPNLRETAAALNRTIETDNDIQEAIYSLREKTQAENILLTLGAAGMTLLTNQQTLYIPTTARKVADVSGAGDTVIATMATMMAAGGDPIASARIANCAAGIVVGEVGAVPVNKEHLRTAVKQL